MVACSICGLTHNVGFISTRFAGTDGVSLETTKWADVFQKEGFSCFYFAGELDRPPDCSYLVEEANFTHPDIKYIYNHCFGVHKRKRSITQKIHAAKERLKDEIYRFIEKFSIPSFSGLLIPFEILLLNIIKCKGMKGGNCNILMCAN